MKKFGLAVQSEKVRYNRVGMGVRNGRRIVTQRAQRNGTEVTEGGSDFSAEQGAAFVDGKTERPRGCWLVSAGGVAESEGLKAGGLKAPDFRHAEYCGDTRM